jgi:hypothetical protein
MENISTLPLVTCDISGSTILREDIVVAKVIS